MKLKPIRTTRKSELEIEKKIIAFIQDQIFDKINGTLKAENQVLNNSKNQIINALRKNKIEYFNGEFKGSFNATISNTFRKLGARFNKTKKAFVFDNPASMPFDIQTAIASQQTNATFLNEAALQAVNDLNIDFEQLDLFPNYELITKNLDKKFKSSISVTNINFNDLLPEAKINIAKEWSDNLELFVKKFTDEEVVKLRNFIQQNATSGFRASNLEAELQKQFKVSKNKAKFLARQETSLFTANYTKQRYQVAGINEYMWSTSQDERVREDHQRLNGKIFSFDDPPIVDTSTGKKANPGEDFNCRCVAIPVI